MRVAMTRSSRGAAMAVASAKQQAPAVPQTGLDARLAIRSGEWTGPTSGIAPGFVQGNLAILPRVAGHRLHAVLPAQSEALPGARGRLAGRPAPAVARRGPRHPHRRRALPRVPQRRAGRRADRHQEALARRPRHLRARLLVLVRRRADRGRHRAAPRHRELRGVDVPHQHPDHGGRSLPRAAGGVDAADEGRPTRSAPSRSRRASPPCTARRSTSASRS